MGETNKECDAEVGVFVGNTTGDRSVYFFLSRKNEAKVHKVWAIKPLEVTRVANHLSGLPCTHTGAHSDLSNTTGRAKQRANSGPKAGATNN